MDNKETVKKKKKKVLGTGFLAPTEAVVIPDDIEEKVENGKTVFYTKDGKRWHPYYGVIENKNKEKKDG